MKKTTKASPTGRGSSITRVPKASAQALLSSKIVGKWRFSPYPVPSPNVKLIFLGLMGFCYNGTKREGEVTFNRASADHKFEIRVFKDCREIPTQIPAGAKVIKIGVTQRSPDVSYYYENSLLTFDRAKERPSRDFRWLLDFEVDDCYSKTVDKNASFFKTTLFVEHGNFYTHQLTNSVFKAKHGPKNGRELGQLAKVIAADIELAAGECLYFTAGDESVQVPVVQVPLCAGGGAKYEIYFSNECKASDGSKCSASDFHLNFQACKNLPHGSFSLELKGLPGDDDPPPGLCITDEFHARVTDSAPCMGAGFGQTDGFPPPQ